MAARIAPSRKQLLKFPLLLLVAGCWLGAAAGAQTFDAAEYFVLTQNSWWYYVGFDNGLGTPVSYEDNFQWTVEGTFKNIHGAAATRIRTDTDEFTDDRNLDVDYYSVATAQQAYGTLTVMPGDLLFHGFHKGPTADSFPEQEVELSRPLILGHADSFIGQQITTNAEATVTVVVPILGQRTVTATITAVVEYVDFRDKLTPLGLFEDALTMKLRLNVSGTASLRGIGIPFDITLRESVFFLHRFTGMIAQNQGADPNDAESQAIADGIVGGTKIVADTNRNVPPVADNDTATTPPDTAILIPVTGNDTDTDGTVDAATVRVQAAPLHGTAIPDGFGGVTYTPTTPPGYTGSDSFTYMVHDNKGARSNAATVTITVGVATNLDLAVAKTVDNGTADEGDTISYTVAVTNNGPAAATGVSLTDSLPAGVTLIDDGGNTSPLPSQGSYHTGTGVWTVGNLANGGAATLTLMATVDGATAGSTIRNNVTAVALDQTDNDATPDDFVADIIVRSTIAGAVAYSGIQDGDIRVGAWDNSSFNGAPIALQVLAGPGAYALRGLSPDTYYVRAFRDVDGDQNLDATEPVGAYGARSRQTAINVPPSAAGILVTLEDPTLDSEPDGLPDWWELHYFGDTAATPNADVDNDGATNAAELAAGSDPTGWNLSLTVTARQTNTLAFGMQVGAQDAALDAWDVAGSVQVSGLEILFDTGAGLKSDIRAVASDTATWRLVAQPAGGRPTVTLQWDRNTVPSGRLLLLEETDAAGDPLPGGIKLDMAVSEQLVLDTAQTRYFRIVFVARVTQDIQLQEGWTLVALRLVPDDPASTAVFAGNITGVPIRWEAGSYHPMSILEPLVGVWVFREPGTGPVLIQVSGQPLLYAMKTVVMPAGWNLIGTADTILRASHPLIAGNFYYYDGQGYVAVLVNGVLLQGRGHWVHVAGGTVDLNTAAYR